MNFKNKITALMASCLVLMAGFAVTSCNDDDEYSTQQYVGGVKLNVYGPSPVARGGELRFLGSGMDKIQGITIPGCDEITDIKVISPEEIRVMVPQTAEPGLLTLRYAQGKITTKTPLTFTEPISLESFTPSVILPGAELTLSGEYLNLINEVIFADDVAVAAEEFTAHSRHEIKLIVPADAQSGLIIISDGAEMPNYIYSEEELTVTLPSVASVLDITKAKPGDEITVTGENLDLVQSVVMPNGDEIEFNVDGDKLTFTLPANASDGAVCMIPASGVKVAVATIGVAVPEECTADPGTNIWAGDVIKVKGVNMELVTDVIFPNVADAVTPDSKSATEITLTVPAGAQSGDLVLNTGSGATVNVAISTIKPENIVYNPSPAALAGSLTVSGKNLQNVAKITFAGETSEAVVDVTSPSATEFAVIVPATLAAGTTEVSVELSNGEIVALPAVELSAPECAYATVLPGEDVEIRAGETAVLTIANAEVLTDVKVNGQPVQYILNGTTLIVQIPNTAGKNSTVTLVSSNGEISYDLAVIPATHVGLTIWEGMWDCGSWGGNQDLAWGGYDWSQVPEGATLTFYMTPTVADGEWWCISLRHGDNWGALAGVPGQYDTPADGILQVTMTREILDDLITYNGLVITGTGYVLNKITIEWEISLETTILQNGWECASWGGNQDLAWGGYDWSQCKAGQTLRFYLTPTVADGEWWCVSLRHGANWGALAGVPGQYDTPASPLEVVLTQEILDDLNANGGLVITGTGYILDKVTIE